VGKTAIISYRTRPETAKENQRLVEQVFAELTEKEPDGLHYASFRLNDGVTFVHIVVTEDGEDPLPGITAFKQFQQGFSERTVGKLSRDTATVVGSYRFLMP
jgi:hypothetical protein